MSPAPFMHAQPASVPGGLNPIFLLVAAILTNFALAAQPVEVVLVLDTSPGTEQSTDRIRPKTFGADDRVGVVGATAPSRLLLGLTEDKKRLADSLQRAGIRLGGAVGGISVAQNSTLDLVGAISVACEQFRETTERPNVRAIIVLFAGEDRALPMAAQRLQAKLDAVHAKLIAIQITRTPVNLGQSRSTRTIPGGPVPTTPLLTTETLADLAHGSGGRIYRQAWEFKEVLKEAMRP